MTPVCLTPLASALAVALVASGCADLFLRARDLEISPNPAQAGDSVSFVFRLSVIPEQDYTIVAFIDSTEHVSAAGFEAVDGPFVLTVGAADDLIAQYGLGIHTGHVEVRVPARDRMAGTAGVSFELRMAPPPP